jgi:hypothetical protein
MGMVGSVRMSERYRLVFRGEILEGQTKAAVKERLGVTLKVDGARLDSMFTGRAVVIRNDADTDTAARFQIAFKRAGARLRVLPVAIDSERPVDAAAPSDDSDARASTKSAAADATRAFRLAPVGALMLEPRSVPAPPSPDTSHLTLASPGERLGPELVVDAVAPDVSHLSVAAPGTTLGNGAAESPPEVPVPAWRIAQPGALLARRAPDVESPVDVDALGFELAPPGAILDDAEREPPPPPPDTSHLKLK